MSAFVCLDHLSKRYGSVEAVSDLSFDVARGEALTLLGPSGCGKTTTLRMIAGLETPDAGSISFDGRPVVSVARRINLPPERRNIGMVFQSYAIWPHMTVAENVGFPLRVRGVAAAERRRRVRASLEMIGLSGLEERPATRLSGGQQQRVALARALIHEPQIILLDEPLSNLDVKLREQMRIEIKLLQRRLGLTLVYVTHDQTEALSLSDRIALLNRGRIEQIGSPRVLYEQPETEFARDFLGKSVTLSGRVRRVAGGTVAVELACREGPVIECKAPRAALAPGAAVDLSVRPEFVRLAEPHEGDTGTTVAGTVEAVLYQGERSECEVRIGDKTILVYVAADRALAPGDPVRLALQAESARVWPK